MKINKSKPKMTIKKKRSKVSRTELLEEHLGARRRQALKKLKPKTRKFKDGKEVTHSDAKRRAYYDTFNEYASERAGVDTRKALRDIARNPKNYKPYKSKKK